MEQPPTGGYPPVAVAVVVDNGRVLLIRRRVTEGRLSWQFPAGKVAPAESADEAAVRETLEETGVVVRALRDLGERVHPDTGRTMIYVACHVVEGSACVADKVEVAEVIWSDLAFVATYIPYSLYGPVQDYLDDTLPRASGDAG